MKELLKQARKNYPSGSLFISATRNIKQPIKITTIGFAKHEDRVEKVKEYEFTIMALYNERIYPKAVQKFSEIKIKSMNQAELELLEERDFLLSIPKDIVNEDGGVIYCGETNTWA